MKRPSKRVWVWTGAFLATAWVVGTAQDFADDTNFENFTMEHLAGVAPQVPRCVGRIYNVANT